MKAMPENPPPLSTERAEEIARNATWRFPNKMDALNKMVP
jgi:hypothetical protein